MLNLQEYMKKTGVTKKHYVARWLEQGLIPGVVPGAALEDTLFPDSARRPYQNRWLRADTHADAVRSHILRASLSKQHICHRTCFMSEEEFDAMIAELARLELVRVRVEDGISYYDSTTKSSQYRDKNLRELRKFLIEVTQAAAKGATEALLDAV